MLPFSDGELYSTNKEYVFVSRTTHCLGFGHSDSQVSVADIPHLMRVSQLELSTGFVVFMPL